MNTLLALIAVLGTYQPQVRPKVSPGSKDLIELTVKRLKTEKAPDRGPIDVCIDGRIELLSIIFRLAGSDEFRGDHFRRYSEYLDARFEPFRDHPAVDFARKLRQDPGVGWDAVPLLAIHLSDFPELKPKVDFDNPALTARWRKRDAEKFSALAATFARDTNFGEFLNESRPIYELASLRMQRLVHAEVDRKWFSMFFREKGDARFVLAVGLLNGSISYGVHVHPLGGPEEIYANVGVWQLDEDGLPNFGEGYLPTIVHEFSHSFVNPSVSMQKSLLRPVGEAFQAQVAALIKPLRYFYWQTLLEETLVRGAVIRYLRERKGERAAAAEIERQKKEGYVWIDEVEALLAEYASSKERFPTFESFLPRVIAYVQSLTPRLKNLVDGKADGAS